MYKAGRATARLSMKTNEKPPLNFRGLVPVYWALSLCVTHQTFSIHFDTPDRN